MEHQVYTIRELAEALRSTKQNIHRHVKRGNIRAVRIGGMWRVPRAEYLRLTGQSETKEEK